MHFPAKTLLLATLATAAHAQGNPDVTLTPAAVQAAVESLRQDPNLRTDKTIRSLHWVGGAEKRPARPDAPAWIVSLLRFFSESASLLIWIVGAAGLAFAAVWLFRHLKPRQPAPDATARQSSSQIENLDIDPASLPADVGSAALGLLEAGSAREALSLLYRGALSRAVHRFAVAVGESFTEGEALQAVTARLDQPRVQYFRALVPLWQRTVYAAQAPPAETVALLCRDFAPTFDEASASPAAAA